MQKPILNRRVETPRGGVRYPTHLRFMNDPCYPKYRLRDWLAMALLICACLINGMSSATQCDAAGESPNHPQCVSFTRVPTSLHGAFSSQCAPRLDHSPPPGISHHKNLRADASFPGWIAPFPIQKPHFRFVRYEFPLSPDSEESTPPIPGIFAITPPKSLFLSFN
jgi:hypothetical protein